MLYRHYVNQNQERCQRDLCFQPVIQPDNTAYCFPVNEIGNSIWNTIFTKKTL